MADINTMTNEQVTEEFNKLMSGEQLTDEEKIKLLQDMTPEEKPLPEYIPSEEEIEAGKQGEVITVFSDNQGRIYNTANMPSAQGSLSEILKQKDEIVIDVKYAEMLFSDYGYKNIPKEDLQVFTEEAMDYRKYPDESYFKFMPESIKNAVYMIMGAAPVGSLVMAQAKEVMLKRLFDELIEQSGVNQAFIDLETELRKLTEEMSDYTSERAQNKNEVERYRYIVVLKQVADNDFANGRLEDGARLMEVRAAFIEAYELKDFENYIKNRHPRIKNYLINEDKAFYKSCEDWSYKYANTPWTLINPSSMYTALCSVFVDGQNMLEADIRRFVSIWFHMTKNYSHADRAQHTFMYYFSYNINAVQYPARLRGKDVEFFGKFRSRLEDCLITMIEVYSKDSSRFIKKRFTHIDEKEYLPELPSSEGEEEIEAPLEPVDNTTPIEGGNEHECKCGKSGETCLCGGSCGKCNSGSNNSESSTSD